MTLWILVNSGSYNVFMPHSTKPSPEPMGNCHQWDPLAFTWWIISKAILKKLIIKMCFKITYENLGSHLPGAVNAGLRYAVHWVVKWSGCCHPKGLLSLEISPYQINAWNTAMFHEALSDIVSNVAWSAETKLKWLIAKETMEISTTFNKS